MRESVGYCLAHSCRLCAWLPLAAAGSWYSTLSETSRESKHTGSPWPASLKASITICDIRAALCIRLACAMVGFVQSMFWDTRSFYRKHLQYFETQPNTSFDQILCLETVLGSSIGPPVGKPWVLTVRGSVAPLLARQPTASPAPCV